VDMSIRLWDARNGACIKIFTGHTNIITGFDMMPLLLPLPEVLGTELLPKQGDFSNSELPPPVPLEVNTDVIASVSDDGTARIFHYNILQLLNIA
jgi:WD40 repeat protein